MPRANIETMVYEYEEHHQVPYPSLMTSEAHKWVKGIDRVLVPDDMVVSGQQMLEMLGDIRKLGAFRRIASCLYATPMGIDAMKAFAKETIVIREMQHIGSFMMEDDVEFIKKLSGRYFGMSETEMVSNDCIAPFWTWYKVPDNNFELLTDYDRRSPAPLIRTSRFEAPYKRVK